MKRQYSETALELMKGAYDLHTHSFPSIVKRSLDNFELLREADKYEMNGVMIKSHYEPTQARVAIANLYAGAKTKAFGSITLNWPVGGLNPYAVENSLKTGARIVWMPTMDAQNCMMFGPTAYNFFERPGITILKVISLPRL